MRLVVVMLAAVAAQAQQFPFQLLLTQGNSASTIQNGATINFNAPIGQTQTASLLATFNGPGQATIADPPSVTGSTAFTATVTGTLPLTLNPGSSVIMNIQFAPVSAALSADLISLAFTQTVPAASGTGSPTVTAGAISVSALATMPIFVESYVLQSNGNTVPLQSGGAIVFPPTSPNTTAQATLNVTNTGSGPGVVTGISVTGAAFRLSNVPLLPDSLAAGQNLQVLILYQPTGMSSDSGQVTITLGSGSPLTFTLQGSGSGSGSSSTSMFTYQILANPPVTVTPGGTITLPSTSVGQTSSVAIQVMNVGNAAGALSTIMASGQGFQVTGVPPLPQTLAAGASLTFTVTLTPAQPGTLTGTLLVNLDLFNLSGVGLGPLLQFSYTVAGSTVTLSSTNNSVIFSPVQITQSGQLSFDVKNTGTQAAILSNIGIGQNNSPFSLSGLPTLPLSLAPGADFQIAVTFTPVALGFSNGTLLLDNTSIGLVGSGTQPPPLPSYTISGPSGTVAPDTQPTVSLRLAAAYPVAIAGTLALTVSGNLPADPSVQFATGGQMISFTIPANSQSAVFGSQGAQIGLQTGTVASTITLTPSFATQAGNVSLTPSSPPSLQFTIAPAAPTLSAIVLADVSTMGFTIEVTGFSPTRELETWSVQFTPAAGFEIPVTQFSLNVQSIAALWFGGTASRAFGGQFTLSVPFTFQGKVPSGQTLVQSVASVSATVSNDVGASGSAMTVP